MSIHSLDALFTLRNGPTIARRLRWLDDRLRWHGFFKRSDLVARFAISPQQASADIASFNEVAPGNVRFDPSAKSFLRADAYSPVFPKDPVRWMDESAEVGDSAVIEVERLLLPTQHPDSQIVAAVLEAYEARRPLKIRYQSFSKAEPSRRTICPHKLVDTGDRLHLRAWDDGRKRFTDFVLGRIASAEADPAYPWVDAVADTQWHEWIEIWLGAHDALSQSQKAAVEMEFGMVDGRAGFPLRKAMVTYFLDRLGILGSIQRGQGAASLTKGVRCLNEEEILPLLPRPMETLRADRIRGATGADLARERSVF